MTWQAAEEGRPGVFSEWPLQSVCAQDRCGQSAIIPEHLEKRLAMMPKSL